MNEHKEHKFPARFPEPVWTQLEAMAVSEERSVNWEVIQAVRERIARKKKGGKVVYAKEDI